MRHANKTYTQLKENGNDRNKSPSDIVPVTVKDTQDTYGKEFLQKQLSVDLTGCGVAERSKRVETVSNE